MGGPLSVKASARSRSFASAVVRRRTKKGRK